MDMEALAQELRREIDIICGKYHYAKIDNVIEEAIKLAERMQQFCGRFLQDNIYDTEEKEYQDFQTYVLQVLEDYLNAVKYKDDVWMLDTLDYGLRELLNIYIDEDAEEKNHE